MSEEWHRGLKAGVQRTRAREVEMWWRGRLDHTHQAVEAPLRAAQEGTIIGKEMVNTFTLQMVTIEIHAV